MQINAREVVLKKLENISATFLRAENYSAFKEAIIFAIHELLGPETNPAIFLKIELEQKASSEIPFNIDSDEEIFNKEGKLYLAIKYSGEPLALIEFDHQNFVDEDLSHLRFIGNLSSLVLQKLKTRYTEPRYRELVENSSDFIYRCNFRGQFLFINSKGQQKMGYTHEEYYGMYFYEMVDPSYKEKAIQFYKEQFDKRIKETYFELPVRSKSGHLYWIGQTVSLHMEDDRVIDLEAIARDITERKNTEEDLLKAKQMLENSIKEKEQFISIMSHEIRTPMNAVVGMTNLLLQSPYYPEQLEYLNGLKISSENLLNILNNVLDLAKMESGNIRIDSSPLYIEEILAKIKQIFRYKAAEKNLQFSISISPDIPGYLLGDSVKLSQILMNLVSNAIKFTEEGGIKIEVRLQNEKKDKVDLCFIVSDTGIGISQESLDTVFQSFIQENRGINQKYGGTGLGLTITKRLVELMGGSIKLTSNKGVGSVFTFTMPFRRSRKNKYPADINDVNGLEGLRALIVEDNPMSLLVASKYLETKKVNVDTCENGKLALEMLKKEPFDFVLMDIQMPVMDGIDATKIFRNFNKETPVIALTASSSLPVAEKDLFEAYIAKPFDPKTFYQTITMVISGKESEYTDRKMTPKTQKKITNLSYLHEASSGNKIFMNEMISIFLKQTPEFLEKLKHLGEKKDWNEFRKVMHKLKPTIFMMGINDLDPVIKKIETCSKEEKNLDSLPDHLEELESYCNKSYLELEKELEKD